MAHPFVDTDVIIRLLTGDDPGKQQRAVNLFEQIEQGALAVVAPDTVIADAVYVLSSSRLYGLARYEVADLLLPVVRLSRFRLSNKHAVIAALNLYGYGQRRLDFGDALIVASMLRSQSQTLYSFDT